MEAAADQDWLRNRPAARPLPDELTVVDLFAGCGGMSLGIDASALAQGYRLSGLAVEANPDIATVHASNLGGMHTLAAPVESLFDGELGAKLSRGERRVREAFGGPDMLVGGPPCQGHSDLNNHTRRNDPRNGLYLRMARAAEVLSPTHVVVENVPSVVHDASEVVAVTRRVLEARGYSIADKVIELVGVGVPQRRRRHLLLATRSGLDAGDILRSLNPGKAPERSVRWAIEDLLDVAEGPLDKPSRRSKENEARIEHLFSEDVYDLPNALRPSCHRDKTHSYKAVYGRLRWDDPAPTITTGFTSMGQGRYVHPGRQRTITPHEAARLQSFPDWFDWCGSGRTLLSTMIGNAVPPLLMARLTTGLLSAAGGLTERRVAAG